MKNLIILLFSALLLNSCVIGGVEGNGNVKERQREVSEFNGLRASGMFEVVLVQRDNPGFTLIADENLHELIESKVENGILIVSTKKNISHAEELKLIVHAPELNELDFSGAVELRSNGQLKGKSLVLSASGAAEIELELEYERISADFSGAAEVTLKGSAKKVKVDASGASELALSDLKVEEMQLDCSGACEADIFVTKSLAVEASGAADISYRGNPRIEKSELSGAASINSKN